MSLDLFYPAKPFRVTQGWGIRNPSYEQFGFSRHNGVDFALGADKKLHAPCDMIVTDVGEDNTKGKYIRFITPEKHTVLSDRCYVGGIFMHLDSIHALPGQFLRAGDFLGIAGNTGFSTGPHTHLSLYRLREKLPFEEQTQANRLDLDSKTNHTIDPGILWNGYHAADAKTVYLALYKILDLLKKALGG